VYFVSLIKILYMLSISGELHEKYGFLPGSA
jgi:hypothetical protein